MKDVFYTDNEKESEERIAEIEYLKRKESIANKGYNEGYLSTSSTKNLEKYNEGFINGKNYSINFGKILGMINSYLFYDEINNYEFLSEENRNKLMNLNEDLEKYQNKIEEKTIQNIKEKIMKIIKNIH
jgi:hypothetical protein